MDISNVRKKKKGGLDTSHKSHAADEFAAITEAAQCW